MNKKKLFVAGRVLDTSKGDEVITLEAQDALNELFGEGNIYVQISSRGNDTWLIHIDRTYPPEEGYRVPNFGSGSKGIYFHDAFILAGNNGQKVIDFGMIPYASCNYFNIYFSEDEFPQAYWNPNARKYGFTPVKSIKTKNDINYFEVEMKL